MPQVKIKNWQLWLDDSAIPLISGEIHYWRLDPSTWKLVLQVAMEMGLSTIASYVQWHFHEYEEAKYDFRGQTDPKRNLVAYLDLIQELNLNLIIRPGPYTFAEWHNYGVPDYLAQYHRLDPKFLKAASNYIREVCELLRPYLATHGGPIILLQADNMFDLGQHRFDRQLGLLGGSGPFQEFLKEKYKNVDHLNALWQTSYADFEMVMATTTSIFEHQAAFIRHLDFLEFRNWFTHKAAAWTVEQYRQNGIDVPIYSNATKDQDIEQMAEALDLVSINYYPTRDYSMVPDEHHQMLNHVRLCSMVSPIPYIAELESGIWHGYHYTKGIPYPAHYRFALLNVLAGGAVAWNWYMFHDRDNWYMSPVNSRGQKRLEIFSVFRQFVELEQEIRPYEWDRITLTGLTYYRGHYRSHQSALEYSESHETSKALYQAGIDYEFYSLHSPGKMPAILFYDGLEWLEEEAYDVLLRYMDQGGHLVVFQRFPHLDAQRNHSNRLGIPLPDGVDSQGYMNTFHKDVRVHLDQTEGLVETPRAVFLYQAVPGEALYASWISPQKEFNDNVLEEYQLMLQLGREERFLVGFHDKRGKGSLTFLGLPPAPDLVIKLHQFLGVPISAQPLTSGIQTTLYRRGNIRYLIVLNNGWEDKGASILLDRTEFPADQYAVRDLLERQEYKIAFVPQEQAILPVSVPGKCGSILEIKPILS